MPLPPAASAYLRDFAAGRFFEAHEDLEALWWERDSDPFLQGLILFAAAYVKVQRTSREGARRHFAAAARYLAPYRPAHLGFDVDSIVEHAADMTARLDAAAPETAPTDVVQPFTFRLSGHGADWAVVPGVRQQELASAVRQAIAERRAAGEPVGPSSWGAVVKEVTRRTGGGVPRAAVRAAVHEALGGAPAPGT